MRGKREILATLPFLYAREFHWLQSTAVLSVGCDVVNYGRQCSVELATVSLGLMELNALPSYRLQLVVTVARNSCGDTGRIIGAGGTPCSLPAPSE